MKASTKQRLRAWADWILPPKVEELIATGVGRFLMKGGARNRDLKNRHANESRVFVVGTGPSLRSHDIKVLREERTIVANSFYMHPDNSHVNPDYCCIGDHRFMRDLPNNVEWFKELEEALPDTTFFVHSDGRRLFRKYGLLKDHEVYFRNRGGAATVASRVDLDLTRPFTVGLSTVSAMSIQLAIYLGFKEIYLVGCDANWLEDPWKGAGHFYDTNEFFPEYDGGIGSEELETEITHVLWDLESHRLLRERADTMGVRIMNATGTGWLRMYPPVVFESLFSSGD